MTVRERFAVWLMEPVESPRAVQPASRPHAAAIGQDGEERGFKRMEGGWEPTEETYVDLYEHGVKLDRLSRWDRAAPLLGLGTILASGAIGAIAGGVDVKTPSVLICGFLGLGLLIGGALLRDHRLRDIRDLHSDFVGKLSMYDDEPGVQAIKARRRTLELEDASARTLPGKLKRIQSFLTGRVGDT